MRVNFKCKRGEMEEVKNEGGTMKHPMEEHRVLEVIPSFFRCRRSPPDGSSYCLTRKPLRCNQSEGITEGQEKRSG